MFDNMNDVDPELCEAALVARIAELERAKSAAAAAQVRLTAALDTARGPPRPPAEYPPQSEGHTAEFTTPTVARHRSQAPPLVGDLALVKASGVEIQIANDLVRHAA